MRDKIVSLTVHGPMANVFGAQQDLMTTRDCPVCPGKQLFTDEANISTVEQGTGPSQNPQSHYNQHLALRAA